MITKGIRGAITVEGNTVEDIKNATLELLQEMVSQNSINIENSLKNMYNLSINCIKSINTSF